MQGKRVRAVATIVTPAQFGHANIDRAVGVGIPPPDFGVVVEIVIVLRRENIVDVEVHVRLGRIVPRRLGANLVDDVRLGFELDPVFITGLAKVEQHRTREHGREQGAIVWLVAVIAVGLYVGKFFVAVIVFTAIQRPGNRVRGCGRRVCRRQRSIQQNQQHHHRAD